ncbi:uncharacterized protein LOC121244222 [Juglans microcarpa x Juglans regia]|uniref:uncharacterized protein LOC121244222 n=1 Tax=Juglans microcarpa x Juglans regia TaxID=2249226 RepID=UPI001B7DDC41|nr:uncharacterized protein LOC121244222 [Juglans microcarpa x Juglans regia]
MLNVSRLHWWRHRLDFDDCGSNIEVGGKLWFMWKNELNLVIDSMSEQHVTMRIVDNLQLVFLTFVYAKCNYQEWCRLWSHLEAFNCTDPWLVMGDFNIIRHDGERCGGRPRLATAMDDFNACLDNCGLIEMSYTGNSFSWCNGHQNLSRSWARLDCTLLNVAGMDVFSEANFLYLPCFMDLVSRAWQEESNGSGLLRLAGLQLHIAELEARIQELENNLQDGYSADLKSDLLLSHLELSVWVEREETRLAQQAKQTWVQKGEANISFFHAVSKKIRFLIKMMRLGDGTMLTSPKQIHVSVVDYFHEFLDLSGLIDIVITEEDNRALCRVPSSQEVYDALWSIPVDSCPGPDGFISGFFKSCWHIINSDMINVVAEFFRGGCFTSVLHCFLFGPYS